MSRTVISEGVDVSALQPMQDHLLLEVLKRDRSEGGIYYPDRRGEPNACTIGKVLAKGPGSVNLKTGTVRPIRVEVGQVVITMDYMGERMHEIGKDYRLVRESGLWATVKLDAHLRIVELEPYSDHALLELEVEEKTLSGALYLPSEPQTGYRTAKVVSIGWGLRPPESDVWLTLEINPGDKVNMIRYGGADVTMKNGKKYRLVQYSDMNAVFQEA